MNIRNICLALCLATTTLLAVSCNETKEETTTDTSVVTTDTSGVTTDNSSKPDVSTMQPTMNCYAGYIGKDSFNLRVEQFPNAVTGSLAYNFFEKDKSEGDLDGKIMGDTLLANYTFSSEGKLSTRQVIFLLKDGTATEGYADMKEQDGKMVFKDLRTVNFSGPKLKNVACHSL